MSLELKNLVDIIGPNLSAYIQKQVKEKIKEKQFLEAIKKELLSDWDFRSQVYVEMEIKYRFLWLLQEIQKKKNGREVR